MKLLLDANISFRMVSKLKGHFRDCLHVDDIGLPSPVKDIELWKYAVLNNCMLVTNDKDFLHLISETPVAPKVILLRTVNQSTGFLSGLIIKHTDNLSALLSSNEYWFLDIV